MKNVVTGDMIAEVRDALNQALDREARLATIIETLPEAVYITSVEGTLQSLNPAAQELFGYRQDELEGLHVSILGPSGSGKRVRSILATIVAGGQIHDFETTHVTSSGAQITTRDAVAPVHDVAGNVVAVIWSSRGIDEIKWLEKLVWEEKERTEAAFDLVADAVLMTDVEGRVVYLNAAAHRLTGWSIAEAHGRPIDQVAPLEHEESRERVESPAHTALTSNEPVQTGFHNMTIHRDGMAFPVEDSAAPIRARDGGIAGAVLVLRPVGRKANGRPDSAYSANEDRATGQIDRRELEHRLERALLTASRDRAGHTLLTIKAQSYEHFIDIYGQTAGDELLRQISVMLRTQIRDMDALARTQGGEFAVLLSHCPLEQGERIAMQIRRVLRNFPFHWAGTTHEVAVQIGVTPITPDSGSVSRILQIGDVACQMADTDGIDLVHVLDVGDINRAMSSRRWDRTRQVARAFDEDRFRLYGQKIRPLVEGGAYGEQVEMLVHMLDDIGDVVPPAVFLPAAERLQLLQRLDRWVVGHVFEMVHERQRSDVASWTINLSEPTLLDLEFPDFVRQQLRRTDTPAQMICFELDESTAIANIGATRALIEELRPVGYAFSISNFGGNPNAFSYLRNLQADYVKIDGSLVRNVDDDPIDRAIIDGIVNVARVMGIRTIASMVEDETALDMLRILGIDYVQGYAVSEPLPIPLSPRT